MSEVPTWHLLGREIRPISSLAGFKDSHILPREITPATRRFTQNCATQDIERELEKIWSTCREQLHYKRKDKNEPIFELGKGSIKFPDFQFTVIVEQDVDRPERVCWIRKVEEIRNWSFALTGTFNAIFPSAFDTLSLDFSMPMNLENVIDRIEAENSSTLKINYPLDCHFCQIIWKEFGLTLLLESHHCEITLDHSTSPKILLEKILALLGAAGLDFLRIRE